MDARLFARAGLALLSFGLLVIAAADASAEKRVALVIGNSKYVHAAELRNPANDANVMADALSRLSFQVIKGVDLDEGGMRQAINQFARDLATAEVALLFYAGHGLQVSGQNYLLPVNAELKNEIDLQFQGVSVNFLLRIMESANRTSIVLLDACRNNPLADRLARSMSSGRGASVSSGLARVETGVGTYIGFSTSPDSVALDGDGNNSPFTDALARHIGDPGIDIESIMRNVRSDVIAATNGHQVPWGNSSLVGRGFVFAKAEQKAEDNPVVAAAPKTETGSAGASRELESAVLNTMRDQTEAIYWQSIQGATDPQFFEVYLKRFPDGVFSDLARLKIETLKPKADAAVQADDQSAQEPAALDDGGQSQKATDRPVQQSEIKTARLEAQPQNRESEEAAAIAPKAEPLARESIAAIQGELVRLGCLDGSADGVWGNRSRNALRDLAARSGSEFAALEPDLKLLDDLKAIDERVCPLVCGRGQVEQDGACIAVKKDAPRAKTANVEKAPKAEPVIEPQKTARQPLFPIGKPNAQRKKTSHDTLKNLNESNRHMLWGQDSDGAQM